MVLSTPRGWTGIQCHMGFWYACVSTLPESLIIMARLRKILISPKILRNFSAKVVTGVGFVLHNPPKNTFIINVPLVIDNMSRVFN